jgi:hypothetical protein
MDSAMLSQPLQVIKDVMLSEFMQPMEGGMLSELASHIVNLTFYARCLRLPGPSAAATPLTAAA